MHSLTVVANLAPARWPHLGHKRGDDGVMADELDMTPRKNALREDLSKEYYAILGVVSEYDGRLMVVKGWSVTLSLAGLGLGFQQQHYALFAPSFGDK